MTTSYEPSPCPLPPFSGSLKRLPIGTSPRPSINDYKQGSGGRRIYLLLSKNINTTEYYLVLPIYLLVLVHHEEELVSFLQNVRSVSSENASYRGWRLIAPGTSYSSCSRRLPIAELRIYMHEYMYMRSFSRRRAASLLDGQGCRSSSMHAGPPLVIKIGTCLSAVIRLVRETERGKIWSNGG